MGKEVEGLVDIGFTVNEAKIYLALLSKNSLTASEISEIARVPRPKVYGILAKLAKMGVCSTNLGKVKRYSIVDPKIGLERMLKHHEDELARKKELISNLSRSLSRIYHRNKEKTDPLEYIEVIKDRYRIIARFNELVNKARFQTLVFSRPPYSFKSDDEVKAQLEVESEVLKKGVECWSIYEIPEGSKEKKWLFRQIDFAVKAGEKARVVKRLPLKMAIFDERIVMITLEDPILKRPSITTLCIQHESLARTLKIVFDKLWEEGKDYHVLLK